MQVEDGGQFVKSFSLYRYMVGRITLRSSGLYSKDFAHRTISAALSDSGSVIPKAASPPFLDPFYICKCSNFSKFWFPPFPNPLQCSLPIPGYQKRGVVDVSQASQQEGLGRRFLLNRTL